MATPELVDLRSGHARRLRRLTERAGRQAARRFMVEGAQSARAALRAHVDGTARVHELVVGQGALERASELTAAAHQADIPVTWASDEVLAALSETVTPQGIVAVVDQVDVSLGDAVRSGVRLVAVLADVRDPGNAGTAIRAADAAGADAVIVAGDSVDPYNGKAVRAAVGGHFHVPLVVGVSVPDAVAAVRGAGLHVLVAEGAATVTLDAADSDEGRAVRRVLGEPTAWIFGNEAWGVPDSIAELADQAVGIPIYGRAESLNLATAVALCLYESARAQRQ